jgi:hypothetical protein
MQLFGRQWQQQQEETVQHRKQQKYD